jgi:hypothetical protein
VAVRDDDLLTARQRERETTVKAQNRNIVIAAPDPPLDDVSSARSPVA